MEPHLQLISGHTPRTPADDLTQLLAGIRTLSNRADNLLDNFQQIPAARQEAAMAAVQGLMVTCQLLDSIHSGRECDQTETIKSIRRLQQMVWPGGSRPRV